MKFAASFAGVLVSAAMLSALAQRVGAASLDKAAAVKMAEEPTLPGFTFYYPDDRTKGRELPILLWGEGSCRDIGSLYRNFLTEVASHGYFVIAIGHIDTSAKLPAATRPTKDTPVAVVPTERIPTPYATPVEKMIEALNWVSAQSIQPSSAYRQRIDPTKIAAMGHSCGGIQAAWTAVHDSRVKTLIFGNSGILDSSVSGISITRDELQTLKIPVLYLLGGPTDIAHPIGHLDLAHYTSAAVFMADMNVGHSATYSESKGGQFADVTAAWLDWQFKHDRTAAANFKGASCRLCKDPTWTIEKKNLD